ncbi:MAG TPA: hypothetical protein VGE26_00945 [Sphingobacteriaceae bacterium]
MEKLLKQNRQLRILNSLLLLGLTMVIAFSFTNGEDPKKRFTEIDVERINIIEKDGSLKMAITNKERQPPVVINGVTIPGRGKAPGIIIFNEEGDECGGFLFDGNKNGAGQILTFDQYKQDQIMSLRYNEEISGNKKERLYGLAISDRPDTVTADQVYLKRKALEEIKDDAARNAALQKFDNSGIYGSNRLFVGKVWNGNVGLYLNDDKGKKRARFFIDPQNIARLEFYDENGNTVYSVPEREKP